MAAAVPTAIRSAFVLGSTSEVAKAICRELARRGCVRFHLVARNAEVNQQLAAELQQRSARNRPIWWPMPPWSRLAVLRWAISICT